MISTYFHCIILLLLSLVSSYAETNNNFSSSSILSTSKKESERLFKGLNQCPAELDNINVVGNDPSAPKLVEKTIRFQKLIDNRTDIASRRKISIEEFGHHAGYFSLLHTKGARMFYYFFESRNNNKNAPVVVWLTGGPGCSGALSLFYINGPFHLADDLSLKWNDFGWDKESNIIYVDQPIGTGFSYSTKDNIRTYSEEAAVDFYEFLQEFFKKYPEYAKNDFFIAGESYAGHYIPAFATVIQRRNQMKQGIKINLKGVAIGNGMTNPSIQHKENLDYALKTNIISLYRYMRLRSSASKCQNEAKDCERTDPTACYKAFVTCNTLLNNIIKYAPNNMNSYDIRKKAVGSNNYDYSKLNKFLDQKPVKEALGVPGRPFVLCSDRVLRAMDYDKMRNFAVYITPLLESGVRVLVYAGEFDLVCSWLGISKWVEELKWPGYSSARFSDFKVDNKKCGSVKGKGPLTFLKVFNAGHIVPMDQPKASLEMMRRWMQNKPL
ncbi:serine carboxypeptidase-like [Andrographis paniculata]|uniref:serine carboxypeptidase-like n=1 Tax=Andrographis paniculata TaxID=175694 RepID=UPI0021E93984|nr:serine carboxypeptidase-like [Andrographis paniculata]